jgi:hypothetical protein
MESVPSNIPQNKLCFLPVTVMLLEILKYQQFIMKELLIQKAPFWYLTREITNPSSDSLWKARV